MIRLLKVTLLLLMGFLTSVSSAAENDDVQTIEGIVQVAADGKIALGGTDEHPPQYLVGATTVVAEEWLSEDYPSNLVGRHVSLKYRYIHDMNYVIELSVLEIGK